MINYNSNLELLEDTDSLWTLSTSTATISHGFAVMMDCTGAGLLVVNC